MNKRFSLSQAVKQYLYPLDLFAQSIQLRINKSDKYATPIGTIASIALLVFSLIKGINDSIEVISQVNPTVVSAEQWTQETQVFCVTMNQPIYLAPDNFTYAFYLSNLDYHNLMANNVLYNLTAENCHRQRYSNNSNVPSIECIQYTLVPCTQRHFQSVYQEEYFKNFDISRLHCLDYQQWINRPIILQGSGGSDNHQYLRINISQCTNSSTYHSCKPQSDINDILQAGYYITYMQDTLLDFTLESTFKPIIRQTQTAFSIDFNKNLFSYYRMAYVNTDTGLFTSDTYDQSGLIFNGELQTFIPSSVKNLMFMQQVFQIETKYTNYVRTYPKLQDVIGIVGGLQQVLYWCAFLIIGPIIQSLLELNLINKFYTLSIKNNDKIHDNKNISRHKSFVQANRIKLDKVEGASHEISKYLKQRKYQQNINVYEYFRFLFDKSIKQLLDYSNTQIQYKLDVKYIIDRLMEVDKLKLILLNDNQLKLFNYFPKIQLGGTIQTQVTNNTPQQIEQAYISYKSIKCSQSNEVDDRLLTQLDGDVISLFEYLIELEDEPKQDISSSNLDVSNLNNTPMQIPKLTMFLVDD